MVAPSRQETEEMARLNAILRGEKYAPPSKEIIQQDNAGRMPSMAGISTGPTKEDVAGMKNAMLALNGGASSAVENLVEDAQTNSTLREALVTMETNEGVKIGAWEIKKVKRDGLTGKKETFYTVNNENTNQNIKAAFSVLESARTVVKLLNQGAELSHPTIKEIAKLECEYRDTRKRALDEKIQYDNARKKNNQFKQDLFEAKFDAAKTQALLVRERIKNIYEKNKN